MRVWAVLAALLGRLPCFINSLLNSPMHAKKATLTHAPVSPPSSPSLSASNPYFTLLSPQKHPEHLWPIIKSLWCSRLPGLESASLLISFSLCQQHHNGNAAWLTKMEKQVAIKRVNIWVSVGLSEFFFSFFLKDGQVWPVNSHLKKPHLFAFARFLKIEIIKDK